MKLERKKSHHMFNEICENNLSNHPVSELQGNSTLVANDRPPVLDIYLAKPWIILVCWPLLTDNYK